MKIAGYGRASTNKQELSPKVQAGIIQEWFAMQMRIKRWGDQSVKFIGMFSDEAVSSKVDMLDRPNGQHLLTILDRGDMIVVAKFSRAFRSAADSERTLDRLAEAGINMVFLDLSIDTSTPNGRYVASIMAAGGRLERDMRSETTRDALQLKKRRGEPVGATPPGWAIKTKGRSKSYVADVTARKAATVYRELLRDGWDRDSVALWLRLNYKSLGIKKPISARAIVHHAAAASVGFPMAGCPTILSITGMRIDSMQFVRADESHQREVSQMIEAKLNQYRTEIADR